MAGLELDLDGSWADQIWDWIIAAPLLSTVDAIDRARSITVSFTAMPGMPKRYEEVTVRQVITKTREELLALDGVGPKTMEVVDAFLEAHGITELGPANASR